MSKRVRTGNSFGMSRYRLTLQRAFAFGLLAGAGAAHAADMPLKAPALRSVYDWTGFYVGGHFGYGGGSLGPGTNPLPEQGVLFPTSVTGLIGGYQVGYNRELANRIVLGIEADSTFTSPIEPAGGSVLMSYSTFLCIAVWRLPVRFHLAARRALPQVEHRSVPASTWVGLLLPRVAVWVPEPVHQHLYEQVPSRKFRIVRPRTPETQR